MSESNHWVSTKTTPDVIHISLWIADKLELKSLSITSIANNLLHGMGLCWIFFTKGMNPSSTQHFNCEATDRKTGTEPKSKKAKTRSVPLPMIGGSCVESAYTLYKVKVHPVSPSKHTSLL